MKKFYFILVLLTFVTILAGCEETKGDEIKVEFMELKYKEGNENPYVLYVSHDEKKYFSRYLEKYEYDFQLEEFKSIEKLKKTEGLTLLGPYYEYYYIPENESKKKPKKYKFTEYKE